MLLQMPLDATRSPQKQAADRAISAIGGRDKVRRRS
jgi:hypothetical protein